MPSSATTAIDTESNSKSAYRSGEVFTIRHNCFSPEAMAIFGRTTPLTVNTRVASPVAAPQLDGSSCTALFRSGDEPSRRLRLRPTFHRGLADSSLHENVCD